MGAKGRGQFSIKVASVTCHSGGIFLGSEMCFCCVI